MFTGLLHTHVLLVTLFLLLLIIKTVLLIANKHNALEKLWRKTRIVEMVIDTLFLITGVLLAFQSGMVQKGNWFWIKIVVVAAAIPISIIAFKRRIKILAVLAVLLVAYAYGVSETKSATMNTAATLISTQTKQLEGNMPMLDLGRIVYTQNCVVCHGVNGDNQASGAPKLSESALPGDQIVTRIKEGKGSMPGYGELLSAEKIQALAAYVQTLSGQ